MIASRTLERLSGGERALAYTWAFLKMYVTEACRLGGLLTHFTRIGQIWQRRRPKIPGFTASLAMGTTLWPIGSLTNWDSRGLRKLLAMKPYSLDVELNACSMVIRTACSSSLTGLHEACVGLQRGECESAIVGGANLIFNPDMTIAATGHGILSPDGRCKTFDESANGYARGEGVVAIHVKRLSDAVRDNDPIRAVIRASSINSDGRAATLSQPSSASHEALMRRTHKLAGIVDVSKTAMIECHGTGTSVGDPLESKAVARVFGERGIYIGSVQHYTGPRRSTMTNVHRLNRT